MLGILFGMYWAIRLLTIVSFTAHAVLGCCLSHGSCMQKQTLLLADSDCGHDEQLCISHSDHETHSHAEQATDVAVVSFTARESCPVRGQEQSRHCDDAKCVFGILGTTTTLSELQFASDATWGRESRDSWLLVSRPTTLGGDQQATRSNKLPNRAVLQVWMI